MAWMFFKIVCINCFWISSLSGWNDLNIYDRKKIYDHILEKYTRGAQMTALVFFLCICFLNLFMTVFFFFFYILASHTAASWCCPSLQHVCFPVCRKAWQTVITSTCQWGLINKQILNHMTACLRWCGKSRIFSITLCINFYGVHREN